VKTRRLLATAACAAAALVAVIAVQIATDTQDDTTGKMPTPRNTTWIAPADSHVHATGLTAPRPDNTTWVDPAEDS
jgi:hypothetical protein